MSATRGWLWILGGLAGIAILTYLPALTQPFISDDYGNILIARAYGPLAGWTALAADPVHRYRPVFLILTYWIDRSFGPWPPAFYAVSIALHVFNTWLVFGLGVWRKIGWRVSALAAAFFAVYEGHQEAVMWYSAAYELLLFFFSLASLIFWILWLESSRRRSVYYAGAVICFVLALASKESAVMAVALMALPVMAERDKFWRGLPGLMPFVTLALLLVYSVFAGGAHHPRLADGSFSFDAPLLVTWLNSYGRLFWIWGLLSLIVLGACRARERGKLVVPAAAWIGITLLPYSFLTYMTRVPSRHTYFASVGVAWIVAAGFLTVWERAGERRKWVAGALAIVVLVHNIGYLWTRKREQYLQRAASTEALVRLASQAKGPVYVHRFPYPYVVARSAVVLKAGKRGDFVIWAPWQPKSRDLNDFLFSLDGKHPVDVRPGRDRRERSP